MAGLYARTDPFALAIKRIILTGYPLKIHKKLAVIRWMFWLPSDVRWYTPVELSTKRGIVGNIKESCGTHGYFKAIFNKPINFNDTVCMRLYRRVQPPPPYTTIGLSLAGPQFCLPLSAVGDDGAGVVQLAASRDQAAEDWDNAEIDI